MLGFVHALKMMKGLITFSILCLTTHLIHQGHEKREEIRDVSTFTAQHVRAALSVLHMAQKIVSRQKHNMLSLLHVACLKLLVFFVIRCILKFFIKFADAFRFGLKLGEITYTVGEDVRPLEWPVFRKETGFAVCT